MKNAIALCALLSLIVVGGCGNKQAADAPKDAQAPAAAAVPATDATQAAQASQAAPAAGAQGAVKVAKGTVIETMDAATYTYIRVKTENGDLWAAADKFPVKVGDKVTVPLDMPMENFRSNSLKKDFPIIYFSSRIAKEGEPDPAGQPAVSMPGMGAMGGGTPSMMSGHGAPGAAPAAPPTEVTSPMALPAGASSIANVWANRKTLAGKSVTVYGKVMKFNAGIMGRNWMHIQDGTGKKADGTNDLTITSADGVKVGDTITATGTLGIDKDFGAGYAYVVILESAKIK